MFCRPNESVAGKRFARRGHTSQSKTLRSQKNERIFLENYVFEAQFLEKVLLSQRESTPQTPFEITKNNSQGIIVAIIYFVGDIVRGPVSRDFQTVVRDCRLNGGSK